MDIDLVINIDESCFYVSTFESVTVYELYSGTKITSSKNINKDTYCGFMYFYGELINEKNGIVSIYNKNLKATKSINIGSGRNTHYHFIRNNNLYFIEWVYGTAYLCKKDIQTNRESKTIVYQHENDYIIVNYCIPLAIGDNKILIQIQDKYLEKKVQLYDSHNLTKIFSNESLQIINRLTQIIKSVYDGGNYIYVSTNNYFEFSSIESIRDVDSHYILKMNGVEAGVPFQTSVSTIENKNAISVVGRRYISDSFKPKIVF